MKLFRRYRWAFIGGGLVVVVLAFLAFRPDKLFVDDVVDESLGDAFAVQVSSPPPSSTTSTTAVTNPTVVDEPTTTTTVAPSTTTVPEPVGPVAVTTGAFYGIDHAAEGTATVYEQDGKYVLRFEDDTDIQNGPDLYVWVLPSADYDAAALDERIDLGKIKGNVGGQNYELPDTFDPDVYHSVLIWCLRFSVPFAAVPLS
ncbi:MAG: DM13 domain-containing protein [Actinomycetota bacterium]|nr:DM13 domain-containing protein [Actinomycetota bacterium]